MNDSDQNGGTGTDKVEEVLLERRRPWGRILGTAVVFVLVAAAVFGFYKKSYIGLVRPEAMDAAQVARNLSEGSGFVTNFVRPFNVAFARPDEPVFPELNSAPLYPLAVSGFLRLKSPSDQVVVWTCLVLLYVGAGATYLLGRLLFDWRAGLLGMAVFAGSAGVLGIATSGIAWTLAAALFALLLCVVAAHFRATGGQLRAAGAIYAALAGVVFGALYMTHYALAFLALPLAVYFAITGGARRLHAVLFVVAALVCCAPGLLYNHAHTGSPVLGIHTWDIMADTTAFPGDTFYRSTDPQNRSIARALLFPVERFPAFSEKLARRSTEFVTGFAPILGLVALPFAVVSALYRFKAPQANAVRGLVYGIISLLVPTAALYSLGTEASLMLAPVAAVFGAAYFLLLVDARKLHPVYGRTLIGAFVAVTVAPTLITLVWGADIRRTEKQTAADQYLAALGLRGVNAVVFTDVPWITAWRTRGLGVWLPRADADVWELESRGLQMMVIVLTPECENYPIDEVWYVLHRVRLWRDYIRDPEEGVSLMLDHGLAEVFGVAGKPDGGRRDVAERLMRSKRRFSIDQSISGFVPQRENPVAADDVQVLMHPSIAP